MKETRYICNLCKEEDEEKYLYGVKYVRIEGDVRQLEVIKELENADAHICTSCICSIARANERLKEWVPSVREDKVKTVGDLKELLKDSEDDEPVVLKMDDMPEGAGYLKCTGVSSTAGGRITILWFGKK